MTSRVHALILLTAWVVLAACSARSDEQLLAAATQRMAQKDTAGAIIELKNLLQRSPDSPNGRLLLGKALLESGDLAGAEIELRRSWELGAPRDQLVPLLAQTLLNSGQSRKLIGEFSDETLADRVGMSTLQQHLAAAHLGQGHLPEAKAAASHALQLTPEVENAVVVDARVKLAGGLWEEALAALDAHLDRSPGAAKAMLLKGEVLLTRGRREEAEAVLGQVLKLDPMSYDARSVLMRMALARQQLDAATQLVSDMPPALASRPQGRFLQAQLALAKGDAAKARELSTPLLKLLPNYLPLLRLASAAHQQLGQLPDAENLLNQALKLAPEDAGLRRQFASLQLQQRAPAKTLDTLRPMLDSGRADAETLMLAGKAQLMQGNFEAADQAFGAASKLRPDDSKTSAALALSALARDSSTPGGNSKAKADAALGQLREIAAKDSGSNYDLMVVTALLRRQDYPAAMAAIDKLAPKMPNSPVPDGLRGRIHLARKDAAAAQTAFNAALKADATYLPALMGLVTLDAQAGRPEDGVKRLEAFITAQPRAAQARLALAELLVQSRVEGDRTVAHVTEVLTAAVREEPSDATLRLALIDHRLRAGDTAAAAQAAQEAVAALPLNADLLERLARTQLASGEQAQARKTYTSLTSLSPTRASGWLGLAQLRFLEQDLAGAEREIKRALQADAKSEAAQRLLIQITLRQGRLDEGLAALRERQKSRPQDAFAYVAEAEVELSRQQPDAALAVLRKATALREPGDAPARLFAALLAHKKREDALAFESQWKAAHAQDVVFQTAAADVLLARGDLDAALARYEGLLERFPQAIALINNSAWLRSKLGKPGALEMAQRGLKIDARYPPLRDTYATVLANEKDFVKAISVQRQLISEQPEQPAYKLNLAQILMQSGDKAGAKTELEGLAKLGPKFNQQPQVESLLKQVQGG